MIFKSTGKNSHPSLRLLAITNCIGLHSIRDPFVLTSPHSMSKRLQPDLTGHPLVKCHTKCASTQMYEHHADQPAHSSLYSSPAEFSSRRVVMLRNDLSTCRLKWLMMEKCLPLSVTMGLGWSSLDLPGMMRLARYSHPLSAAPDIKVCPCTCSKQLGLHCVHAITVH